MDLVLLYANVHKVSSIREEILSEFYIRVGKYIDKHNNVDKFFIGDIPNRGYIFLTVKNLIRKRYHKELRHYDSYGNNTPSSEVSYQSSDIDNYSVNLFTDIEKEMLRIRRNGMLVRTQTKHLGICTVTYLRILNNIKHKYKLYY